MNHSALKRAGFRRNGASAEQPLWETAVWECTSSTCAGWMRQDMAFDELPTCPLCQSEMQASSKQLPRISNREVK